MLLLMASSVSFVVNGVEKEAMGDLNVPGAGGVAGGETGVDGVVAGYNKSYKNNIIFIKKLCFIYFNFKF